MNEVVLFDNKVGFSVSGLRKGQAELYKYIELCNRQNTPINSKEIAFIYFNHVRNPNWPCWDMWSRHWAQDDPRRNVKNKDAWDFYSTNEKYKDRFGDMVMGPAKQWLKVTIGSLVMRGLLNIVPKLDMQLLEK